MKGEEEGMLVAALDAFVEGRAELEGQGLGGPGGIDGPDVALVELTFVTSLDDVSLLIESTAPYVVAARAIGCLC